MLKAMRNRMKSVAALAVAGALGVSGVAVAQDNGGSQTATKGAQSKGKRPPGPPPMGGTQMKGLTYAQFHVENADGEAEVLRSDQGEITAVDSDSITLKENDGNEVTVALDDSTRVMGKPGQKGSIADLAVGEEVSVSGPEGEAAKAEMSVPTKAELAKGMRGTMGGGPPMGPPPERRGSGQSAE